MAIAVTFLTVHQAVPRKYSSTTGMQESVGKKYGEHCLNMTFDGIGIDVWS